MLATAMGYRLVRGFIRLLLRLFYRRVNVVGAARIPAAGPLIIAANHHNSLVDPMLIMGTFPRRITVLAKAPLFRHPLIGPFLRTVGALPVNRRAEAGPRDRQQHADDDNGQDERVLDERLTLGSAQTCEQCMKRGHTVLPLMVSGHPAPLVEQV